MSDYCQALKYENIASKDDEATKTFLRWSVNKAESNKEGLFNISDAYLKNLLKLHSQVKSEKFISASPPFDETCCKVYRYSLGN